MTDNAQLIRSGRAVKKWREKVKTLTAENKSLTAENKRLWKFVEFCCTSTANDKTTAADSCFEIAEQLDVLYADIGEESDHEQSKVE